MARAAWGGGVNRWGAKKPTQADNRAVLLQFLYSRPPHVLPTLTVDQLMARHGVDRKTAQYELMICQQKRAGEA